MVPQVGTIPWEVHHRVLPEDARGVSRSRVGQDVLRAYDNMQCSDEFRRRNFASSDYINEQGKTQRSVTMIKDGFVMLAMGFAGPSAMAFKVAYITGFNAMDDRIARLVDGASAIAAPAQGLGTHLFHQAL